MGKYTPLTEWLKGCQEDSVVRTFGEIEEIIGDELPCTAQRYFTFWANWSSKAWVEAGFETVMVDRENKKVKFKRI